MYAPRTKLQHLYFYPRPPRGGRRDDHCNAFQLCNFYPRPPRGGRLNSALPMWMPSKFLSTPSARRATRPWTRSASSWAYFYPRPPRGGRQLSERISKERRIFLSTPSARRATARAETAATLFFNFYPRPPRGGRPSGKSVDAKKATISIHALREEGDLLCDGRADRCAEISIHALREEGDVAGIVHLRVLNRFLSTPSARRATMAASTAKHSGKFLSTPSARRATPSS